MEPSEAWWVVHGRAPPRVTRGGRRKRLLRHISESSISSGSNPCPADRGLLRA